MACGPSHFTGGTAHCNCRIRRWRHLKNLVCDPVLSTLCWDYSLTGSVDTARTSVGLPGILVTILFTVCWTLCSVSATHFFLFHFLNKTLHCKHFWVLYGIILKPYGNTKPHRTKFQLWSSWKLCLNEWFIFFMFRFGFYLIFLHVMYPVWGSPNSLTVDASCVMTQNVFWRAELCSSYIYIRKLHHILG